MPLISCSDCKASISARALACPHCGCPVAAAGAQAVVTTQATGKKHKEQQLLAGAVLCLGAVLVIAGMQNSDSGYAPWGAGLMLLGLIWYLVARFRAWWGHG